MLFGEDIPGAVNPLIEQRGGALSDWALCLHGQRSDAQLLGICFRQRTGQSLTAQHQQESVVLHWFDENLDVREIDGPKQFDQFGGFLRWYAARTSIRYPTVTIHRAEVAPCRHVARL
jgi:hypothetical protein